MHFRTGKNIPLLIIIILGSFVLFACSSTESSQIDSQPTQEVSLSQTVLASEEEKDAESSAEFAPIDGSQPVEVISKEESEPAAGNPEPATSGGAKSVETGASPSIPSADPSLPVAPNIGALAPNFSLTTVDGEQVSLYDLRGKSVMVNYWVTWCVPCIEEMPVLEKLHREYQDQDFVMLSINGIAQDDLSTVMNTLGEFGVTFPVVLDKGDEVYNEFQVRFMPTSFFIDQQGVIRHIQLGSTTEDGFRTTIENLLSEQL